MEALELMLQQIVLLLEMDKTDFNAQELTRWTEFSMQCMDIKREATPRQLKAMALLLKKLT